MEGFPDPSQAILPSEGRKEEERRSRIISRARRSTGVRKIGSVRRRYVLPVESGRVPEKGSNIVLESVQGS